MMKLFKNICKKVNKLWKRPKKLQESGVIMFHVGVPCNHVIMLIMRRVVNKMHGWSNSKHESDRSGVTRLSRFDIKKICLIYYLKREKWWSEHDIYSFAFIWRIRAIVFVSLREAIIRIFQKLMHVSLAQFTDPDHLNIWTNLDLILHH